MPADSPVDFVYRLILRPDWAAAQDAGIAPLRAVDRADGYLHLSTRAQVIETANRHFAGATDLLALEIPLDAIADKVKFEPAPKRGEDFPHLYGALSVADVTRVIALALTPDGFQFGDAE